MTEYGLKTNGCSPSAGCLIDPETGCQVVNQAIEEIRQALLQHYELLSQVRETWQQMSPFELLDVVAENYCDATRSPAGSRIWQLMEIVRRIFFKTFHTTSTEIVELRPDETFIQVGIVTACYGYNIDLPKEPLSVTEVDWPFWLEEIRSKLTDKLGSFNSIHKFTGELVRESVLVEAILNNGIRLRESRSGEFASYSEENLAIEIAQCQVIISAVNVFESTTSRIGQNLQIIVLTIAETDASDSDLVMRVSELNQSPGFQQIGPSMLTLLADRYHAGHFFIRRSELANLTGGSKNAFKSALAAMKKQKVLVGNGFDENEDLWSMPIVCSLTEYLQEKCDEKLASASKPSPIITPESTRTKDELAHDGLLAFADVKLPRQQQKALRFIVAQGGRVPLPDLVFHMDWGDEFKNAWNGLKSRINASIEDHNRLPAKNRAGVAKVSLGLIQCDNHAVLLSLKLIADLKKQASKVKSIRQNGAKK